MRKVLFAFAIMVLCGSASVYAQELDALFYNPKNDNNSTSLIKKNKKKESNYIADFSSVDVDAYNRRGQIHYQSPSDTIGTAAENGSDFVYTQQIQKYYNPTIVVDNANLLEDVLENSYGNVEIVFDNGLPLFAPYYSPYYSPYYYGYYNRWYSPWHWNWGWGTAWNPSLAWGPSWTWGWGWDPYWSWNYPWYGPGYYPSWSWGWGWNDPWYHPGGSRPHYGDYAPQGRYPNRPGSHWASDTRPGSSIAGGRIPGGSNNPSYSNSTSSGSIFGGSSVNHRRQYKGEITNSTTSGTRYSGGNYNPYSSTSNRRVVTGSDGHRYYTNGSATDSKSSTQSSSGYRRSSNSSNSSNSSSSSYNSNSNSSRSSYNSSSSFNSNRGSSFGGSRSTGGGGGRGRHR